MQAAAGPGRARPRGGDWPAALAAAQRINDERRLDNEKSYRRMIECRGK
jgi:hypothetical protein